MWPSHHARIWQARRKDSSTLLRESRAHVTPVTAAHNNRLYGGPPQIIDDLLPTTLVWYASPCEASAAYTSLAELIPENRLYANRSRTCETLPAPHSAMAN
jgi:hypothetical protein